MYDQTKIRIISAIVAAAVVGGASIAANNHDIFKADAKESIYKELSDSDEIILKDACEYLNDGDYINGIKKICDMENEEYKDSYISEILYQTAIEAVNEYKATGEGGD